jgi:tight adherence protein C
MAPTLLYLPLFGILLMLLGAVVFIVGMRLTSTSELDQRLQNYLLDPLENSQSWINEEETIRPEITGSLVDRTLVPTFRRLGGVIGRLIPRRSIQALDKQLIVAGNPLGLRGREFYGIRIVFIFLAGLTGYAIISRSNRPINFLAGIFVTVMLFSLPRLWLRYMINKRKYAIRRNLPDGLDMLTVCADAGLGFDQSLQRISEEWNSPLAKEFSRVVSEMSMGQTRAVALRNMADRLDVMEVSSFVAVILQSYELGMGIIDALHAQANQMRIERRYWAQERARGLPLKMLFPLLLLILPAMFAVILGPLIPAIREIFSSLSQGGVMLP